VLSEKDIVLANNKRCLSLDQGDIVFDPYPNPSSGTLHVDWVTEKSGQALISVFNSMGQLQYEWETAGQAGLNQSEHDLSFLGAGMYYVTIKTSASIQTLRFLRY
jgi:Secretion system C-terminal sorting domain